MNRRIQTGHGLIEALISIFVVSIGFLGFAGLQINGLLGTERGGGSTTRGPMFDRGAGRHGTAGFTLIELMIVVAAIAILAAIAYPSYADAVRKSNRASAESHLMDIAQRQQQYLLDSRGSYASSLSALNVTTPNDVAARYTIAITVAAGPPPTFTAKATPTGAQATDLAGADLTVDNTGSKSPSGAW